MQYSKEKNIMWRGDDVGYNALHAWVRRHKESNGMCNICKLEKRLDLANISQEYKRDIDDWEYLCRKCHMIKDGRLEKIKERNIACTRKPINITKEFIDKCKLIASKRKRDKNGKFINSSWHSTKLDN